MWRVKKMPTGIQARRRNPSRYMRERDMARTETREERLLSTVTFDFECSSACRDRIVLASFAKSTT
jgi:hypothetical protein